MSAPEHQPGQSESGGLLELLRIALPTIATMMSVTVMQWVDARMVAQIGPEPHYVAAQGNGGMAHWLILSAFFGGTTVINTYVSQNVGAGKPGEASRYAWAGVWMGLLYWPVMLLGALVVPTIYSGSFEIGGVTIGMGHTGELLRLEVLYAQILMAGAILKLSTKGITEFFFGVHRPIVVTVSVVAGNITNVVANYVLIFGRVSLPGWAWSEGVFEGIDGALPAMGVVGAAIGTLIGTLVESAIQVLVFLAPGCARAFGTRRTWRSWTGPAKEIIGLGWPAGLMMVNEMFCWWFLMVYLLGAAGAAEARASGAGDEASVTHAAELSNAVGWIGLRYMHMAFMPTVGLSIAITAIVGKYMGKKRADLAERRTWLALSVALAYMGLCAVAFVVFSDGLIGQFIDDGATDSERAEILELGGRVMIAAALFQLADALGIMLIGALRGAGDTKWPGMVTVVLSWVVLSAGGLATVHLTPQFGSLGPWAAAAAYIIALGLAMLWRFMRGPWRTIELVKQPSGGVGAATVQAMAPGVDEGVPEPETR